MGDIGILQELKEMVAFHDTSPWIKPSYNLFYLSLPLTNEKILPSIMQAPTLELKPFWKLLKYVYLGKRNTFPIIIASKLMAIKEEKLIWVLRENKIVIGWTIVDNKEISASMFTHWILLQEDSKK